MRCAGSEAPASRRELVRIAMPNLARLPAWAGRQLVHVVVETPRGARAKLTFDPELKTFVLSKSLMLGLSYPYDLGFIPSTRAEDGDPLDVMVIHDAATTPGLVLRCKLIGVLQTIQKTKHDQIRNESGSCKALGTCRPRSKKSWKNSSWPPTSWKPRH